MSDIKVLIADDDPGFLTLVSRQIQKLGYEIATATNGKEAIEAIKSQSPDVIILDIVMPKMDGLAVLEEIRKNPPAQKWQPVIMVSGHSDLEDLQGAYDLEADHYITKPCKVQDLKKIIDLMVQLIPQRKEKEEE